MMRAVGLATVALTAACSPPPSPHTPDTLSVIDTSLQGAPRPPRAEPCTVETLTVLEDDMTPSKRFGEGGEYEVIGWVQIRAQHARQAHGGDMVGSSSTGPGLATHPAELELARPYACHMGGEAVSMFDLEDELSSTSVERYTLYAVWAKRQR